MSALRTQRKSLGLCIDCGAPADGAIRCEQHLKAALRWYYRTRVLLPNRNRPGEGRSAERKLAANRAYNARHRERRRASGKRTKAKNPDLYLRHAKQSQLRRRSRMRGAAVEAVSIPSIIRRDSSICHLCLQAVEKPSMDHLIPVSRGGAYAEWNLMVSHEGCNKGRKNMRILDEETKSGAEAYIAAKVAVYSARRTTP